MKRIAALLLVTVLLLNLCACGKTETPADISPSNEETAPATGSEEETPPDPAAETGETAAPAAEPTLPVEDSEPTETPEEEQQSPELKPLMESERDFNSMFSLLAVSPNAQFFDADGNEVSDARINTKGADALISWLLSAESRRLIEEYEGYGFGGRLFEVLEDAPECSAEIPMAEKYTEYIRLSTTSSVKEYGLLNYLLPFFTEEYGYEVEVRFSQKAKAFSAARHGKADLLLTHDKENEELFIADGFARIPLSLDSERVCFMKTGFVLCGPADDPAGVADAKDFSEAFARIADGKYPFVSRGDGSFIHMKELSFWNEDLGITEDIESYFDFKDWYISAGTGMDGALELADMFNAYILSDSESFRKFAAEG